MPLPVGSASAIPEPTEANSMTFDGYNAQKDSPLAPHILRVTKSWKCLKPVDKSWDVHAEPLQEIAHRLPNCGGLFLKCPQHGFLIQVI
jgi:hypothetical protein